MKTVIVTGATGNMGQAVCRKFLAEGWRVVGTTFSHSKNDEGTLKNFELVAVDLSDERASDAFISDIINRYRSVEALVATVGGFATGSLASTGLQEVYAQLKLNFDTAFNVAKPCFTHMLAKNSGRIFLVSSRAGLRASEGKGAFAYGIAKSMIIRMAETLNLEAKGKDVVTAVLVPGTIDTPQNREAMPGEDFSKWVMPSEIAEAVFFYSSESSLVLREPILKLYKNS